MATETPLGKSPHLHSNLLIASGQWLFWLFLMPTACRHFLLDLFPDLPPDFCLVELNRTHWRRVRFWRLLLMSWVVIPTLAGGLIGMILWWLSAPKDDLLLWVSTGIAICFLLSFAVSVGGSLLAGTIIGWLSSFMVGIGSVLIFGHTGLFAAQLILLSYDWLLSLMIGATSGVCAGIAYSITSRIDDNAQPIGISFAGLRQLGSLVMGIAIGVLFGRLVNAGSYFAVVLAVGVPFGVAVGWRTRNEWRGFMGGMLVGLLGTLVIGLSVLGLNSMGFRLVGMGAFVTSLFALPYFLGKRVVGMGAGTLAGTLSSGGGVFFLLSNTNHLTPILLCSLFGTLLGLALMWWRPILTYPLVAVWNTFLLKQDEKRLPANQPSLMRWHSAFWDEWQRLPLFNLDNHLLLLRQHNDPLAQSVMDVLRTGRQYWAVQAVQIELDARRLIGCQNVEEIAGISLYTPKVELNSPVNTLLRSFGRISQDVQAALNQDSAYNQRLALTSVEERLDSLMRELTRSNEPYIPRFHTIAAHWRQLITQHNQTLLEAADARREIDSPYIIGIPLTAQQEIFIGRADISARIEQLLLDPRQPPLLLYGQRRMGKTSLLNNLGRLFPSQIVPLFVDLQGPASRAKDNAGFLYNLARSMIRSAHKQRNIELPPLTLTTLQPDPFTYFDEWLDEVQDALDGRIALLMLDEFEVLEQMLSKQQFDEEVILGMLRHLIQHRPQFKVLLSGSHTLEQFQRWSGYLINVQVIHISYLHEDEARQLIEYPVENFALRYQPEATQRVLQLTHCHPFLIQLLCAEIVALKNDQPLNTRYITTPHDVDSVVPAVLQHGSFFFADIQQNQADSHGTTLLQRLAQESESTPLPPQVLETLFSDKMILQATLNMLQQRELIESTINGYRFQVPLVQHWFQQLAFSL